MAIAITEHGHLALSGDIVFENSHELLQPGLDYIASAPIITVDFSKVEHTDSSALALLIAWYKAAKTLDKKLVLQNLPKALQNLSRVSGVDGLLSVKS